MPQLKCLVLVLVAAAAPLCNANDVDEEQASLNMQFFAALNAGDVAAMEEALEAGADIDGVVQVSEKASLPAIMHTRLA